MDATRSGLGLWGHRFGWMILIWTASVAALAVVALGLRLLMSGAGMTE